MISQVSPRDRRRRPRRRGTIYLVVLGVTMIIGVMAVASATVSRLELRSNADASDRREARVLARTAVEFAIAYIENENNHSWRNKFTNNTLEPVEEFGVGSFTFKLVDDDDDLDNGDTHACTIYGYGYAGDAVAVESVRLQPGGTGINCLEVALCVGSGFTLPSGHALGWNHVYTNQMVAANGAIDASGSYADINGDAWASGAIAGTVTGTAYPNQGTAREVPGPDVFDYYLANGTWIDIGSLPENSGRRHIYRQVLSAGNNPWGGENAEGIYVIDCQGQDVRISESRILATLVLLNNGSGSDTESGLCWEPAVPNYPALLVENDFTFDHSVAGLSEASHGVNYNPPGTPIDGDENTSTTDTLPYRFDALVYIGGQLRSNEYFGYTVEGCVVCGSLLNDNIATFNYDDVYLNFPPPGFRAGDTMEIVPGSWRRASVNDP